MDEQRTSFNLDYFSSNKVLIFVSSKEDGEMNVFSDGIIEENNRRKFFKKIGINSDKVILPVLEHGSNIKLVKKNDAGKLIKQCDGLITKEKGLFLSVTVADCLPILLYNSKTESIGIIHAGWKGLSKKIISNFIKIFCSEIKSLNVVIGPAICKDHFEVKEDLLIIFKNYPDFLIKKGDKSFIDLKGIAKKQFINLGVLPSNIKIIEECTFCLSDKYFSYRKDKSNKVKSIIVLLGLINN